MKGALECFGVVLNCSIKETIVRDEKYKYGVGEFESKEQAMKAIYEGQCHEAL